MKKFFLYLSIVCLVSVKSFGQVVWTSPLFPSISDNITLFYDASEGNGALANYNGDIFIHTGLITNLSTGPTDWKHVVTTWGSTDPAHQLTSLGNDLYSFNISNITTFYGLPGSEIAEQLAMVFRNGDGSIVGRASDGSDIYYDVWDGTSLITKFLKPEVSPYFVNLNDPVNTVFVSSKEATITLYQNDIYVTQFSNTDSINYSFTATANGKTWIKAVTDDGISEVEDSFYYVVNPPVVISDLPLGTDVGINHIDNTTVTLVLTAPNKQYIYAVGDFSNWEVDDATYMNKTPDGKYWWVTLSGLTPQQEYRYQFLVDGNLHIADPYADKVLDPWNDPYISATTYPNLIDYPTGKASGIVSVFQPGEIPYVWQDAGFVKPAESSLIIYELLIRDFLLAHDYTNLIDTLDYLKNLGVNAIELMPVSEFEGNISWGYNPDFYFAPDKYYGTENGLRAFIDACHQNGIAVIHDVVLNHSCGQSPMCQLYWDPVNSIPGADNPWYNQSPTHDFNVCYDFNHESSYTEKFVDDVLEYWVTEYHMDGFRFDLSKGFTQTYSVGNVSYWGQYDQSRIDNLKRIADNIWDVDPNSILILEHFAEPSEEQALSNHGFLLWSNSNYNYAQCAMGYSTSADISWISYTSHGFSQPRAVGYMESHDEERVAYKVKTYGASNATYNVKPLDSMMNRIEQAACFFIPVPGPKMIWQFGELGYDYTICYPGNDNDCKRTDPKPIKWDYFQSGPRRWAYNVYAALNHLKREHTVFQTGTIYMDAGGLYKSIRLSDGSMKVCIIGNFDIVNANVTPYFLNTGKWYEYFTGDSITVTDVNAAINLQPGEYRLYTDVKLQLPDLGNVGVGDVSKEEELKLSFFPNPASHAATIDFYIGSNERIQLQLYDLSGKTVKTIADKILAPGWYTVDVQLEDVIPGTYLLQLVSSSAQKIVKIEVQ